MRMHIDPGLLCIEVAMKIFLTTAAAAVFLTVSSAALADGTSFLKSHVASTSTSDWIFDFDAIAKRSLSQHWDSASVQQQSEFRSVLAALVKRSFKKHITEIRGHVVEYLDEKSVDGVVSVEVRTIPKSRAEEPSDIVFRLRRDGDSYMVIDVVVEGSSMVDNYRKQFHKIVTRDGLDALIKRLKDKLDRKQ